MARPSFNARYKPFKHVKAWATALGLLLPFQAMARTPSASNEELIQQKEERIRQKLAPINATLSTLREEQEQLRTAINEAVAQKNKPAAAKANRAMGENRRRLDQAYNAEIPLFYQLVQAGSKSPCLIAPVHGEITMARYQQWKLYGFNEEQKKIYENFLNQAIKNYQEATLACVKDENEPLEKRHEAYKALINAPPVIAENSKYAAVVIEAEKPDDQLEASETIATTNISREMETIKVNQSVYRLNVVHNESADAKRFPASLTKIVALKVIFDALKEGKLSWDDQVKITEQANTQEPSILVVNTGRSIPLKTALQAITVLSANNVIYAVAQKYPGGVEAFVNQMNNVVADLGVAAHFSNPTGLPDDTQQVTARAIGTLLIATAKFHPDLFKEYFALTSMTYEGHVLHGHNPLLNLEYVTGGKTGFIYSSGFNMALMEEYEGKEIAVVVMGCDSASLRNNWIRQLSEMVLGLGLPGMKGTPAEKAKEQKEIEELVKSWETAAPVALNVEASRGHNTQLTLSR